jgi:sulfatase modifying factor 1
MGSNPSKFKGDDDRPVEQVSWEDIQEFERRTGLSLPTDAQWEYACRADTTTPFAGTGNLDDMGWYRENSGFTTHPVGQKAPNQFGLQDVHGNVSELCEDMYDKFFFGKPEAREPDPVSLKAPGDWVFRVVRGGSHGDGSWHCRTSTRDRILPAQREGGLGFRAACRVP